MMHIRLEGVPMVRRVVLGVSVLCTAASFAPAGAAAPTLEEGAPPLAVQRYRLARDHYVNGRFKEALADFQVALRVFPTSAKLVYNLARTHERLEMWAEAQRHYRRYLELSPGASDRAEVEAVIAVLAERGPPEAVAAAAPPSSAAPTSAPPTLVVRLAPVPREVPPAWTTPVGWTAVGFGVAGWALGLYGYMSAREAAADVSSLPPGRGDDYDRLSRELETGNTLSVVGVASGLVLGGAGALLLTWPFDGSETVVGVVPTTDGVTAGLSLVVGPRLE
jgi:tetratricopeptide (TPR) repeat protein